IEGAASLAEPSLELRVDVEAVGDRRQPVGDALQRLARDARRHGRSRNRLRALAVDPRRGRRLHLPCLLERLTKALGELLQRAFGLLHREVPTVYEVLRIELSNRAQLADALVHQPL